MLVAASAVWNVVLEKRQTIESGRIGARISIEKDLIYRHWNTNYGGVYVPVGPETQPNPYLAHVPERDIRTPSGKLLTFIRPS